MSYYEDDETSSSTEGSSIISSIDTDSQSSDEDQSKEEVDEESMSIRKIKMKLDELFQAGGTLTKLLRVSPGTDEDNYIIGKHIENIVNVAKNIDNLDNYNTNLIAIAGSYDILYKGVIEQKNVTNFMNYKELIGSCDPIDVIRYITLYHNKK